jgi:hypothetical protein
MYFSQLPYLEYDIEGVRKLVTNILTRVAVSSEIKDNIYLYEEYTVKDGETPESIAFDRYGSTQYHWIVMLINEIIYPWNDWALSTSMLRKITQEKYGAANLYAVHHYIDENGFITSQTVGTFPVSNLDYEIAENDAKRNIKLIEPSLISAFVKEFKALVQLG